MSDELGLAEVLARYGTAYLATVGADMRAHIATVRPRLRGAELVADYPGRTTSGNVELNAAVSLVWPPAEVGDYSLMVDGAGSLRDGALVVVPTRAVLHRPAEPGNPRSEGRCAADCIEVPVPDQRQAAPGITRG
jgi:hypothetical protein